VAVVVLAEQLVPATGRRVVLVVVMRPTGPLQVVPEQQDKAMTAAAVPARHPVLAVVRAVVVLEQSARLSWRHFSVNRAATACRSILRAPQRHTVVAVVVDRVR
jgi:hypothetical protein